MGVERRILPERQELGSDTERSLASQALRCRAVVVAEDVELRRGRRGAERSGEAAARLVEIQAVQDSACEIALADEDARERQTGRGLVELRVVRPRAAVDVVDRRETVAVQVLQALELADTDVLGALDGDGLELAAVER